MKKYEVVTWEESAGFRAVVALKVGSLHVHTVTFSRDSQEDTPAKIAGPRDELAKHFREILFQGDKAQETLRDVIKEMERDYTSEVVQSDQRNIGRWHTKLKGLLRDDRRPPPVG